MAAILGVKLFVVVSVVVVVVVVVEVVVLQVGVVVWMFSGCCIVLIALSRCNRVFTRRLRLCHSHTVYRREVRKGDREGPNRVESEV